MTENVPGYNCRLARGAATGVSLPAFLLDTYSDILDIESLTPPSPTRQTEEYYVLDQKASKKIVGSITYEPCAGTLVRAFGDSIQESLEDDANADVSVQRNWRLIMPDSGNMTQYFVGIPSKFQYGELTNQGRITATFEIVVNGAILIVR